MQINNPINSEDVMELTRRMASAGSIALAGHIHPDGDAVGSCLGLAHYISLINKDAQIDVYLESFSKDFDFLIGADTVRRDCPDTCYDLFISLDCADAGRLGDAEKYLDSAGFSVCLDHHITNTGFADINIIRPAASSTCEVVCGLVDFDILDKASAECLYLGIVHDTGVFKHSCTGHDTMCYAGELLTKGISSSFIIDNTFYKKTFAQNKALARVLDAARLLLDGRYIVSTLSLDDMRGLGVKPSDMDGIIDQLRVTEGVLIAAFIYQQCDGHWKVSMRANDDADVSVIAACFGGGGHVKAAGFDSDEDIAVITESIYSAVQSQLS